MIRNAQKVAGIISMDIYTRRLFESRMFEKPIAHMKEKVFSLLAGNETRDTLKYYI